jgi:small-conductance mechanosensitive channel
MIDIILKQSWTLWGLAILFGMPLALLILTEIMNILHNKRSIFYGIAANVRNILLPVTFLYLLTHFVLELDADAIAVKLSATAMWIILIHSSLSFINTLVFSEFLPAEVRTKIPKLLVDFFRIFLVLLGAAFVMSTVWGADLGSLLAALGVGSVVLGLALQDVLGGLFSGLALLSSRPFVVNDWIKVGETEGRVVSIDWRAVSLETRENDVVTIPNSVLASSEFENYLRPNIYHMERVGFDISFDDPPTKVKNLLVKAAKATDGILDHPPPIAALISYDEFSVHYEVRYFIDNYDKQPVIRDAFSSRIWYANRREGITFPTRAHEIYRFDGAEMAEHIPTTEETADRLKQLGVLDLSTKDLCELAKHSQIEFYGNNECMAWKGEISKRFFIILDGEAIERSPDDEGNMKTCRTLTRGDFFGVAAMIRREPHNTNIIAKGDIEVISIELNTMRRILQLNPKVAQCLESIAESRSYMTQTR